MWKYEVEGVDLIRETLQVQKEITYFLKEINKALLRAMESSKIIALVLLDLSAAFDIMDHNILLQRLERDICISTPALRWCESYLKNRSQSVWVGDSTYKE